jgi:hypothetical protein
MLRGIKKRVDIAKVHGVPAETDEAAHSLEAGEPRRAEPLREPVSR